MKCAVCKKEVSAAAAVCPGCGFPNLRTFGPEGKRVLAKLAEEYSANQMTGMELGVIAYSWKVSESGYQLCREHEIPIEMSPDAETVAWAEKEFARTGKGGQVEITFYLREKGKPRRTKTVGVSLPDQPGFWRAGARRGEGLNVVLCVGNKMLYSQTKCDIMEFK